MCGRLSDAELLSDFRDLGVASMLDTSSIWDSELPATDLGKLVAGARAAVKKLTEALEAKAGEQDDGYNGDDDGDKF